MDYLAASVLTHPTWGLGTLLVPVAQMRTLSTEKPPSGGIKEEGVLLHGPGTGWVSLDPTGWEGGTG